MQEVRYAAHLPLPVRVIVDVNGEGAGDANGDGGRQAPVDGVLHQVQGRGGVDCRHPVEAAPAQVVAGPVMRNVHRAPVPSFPPAHFFAHKSDLTG